MFGSPFIFQQVNKRNRVYLIHHKTINMTEKEIIAKMQSMCEESLSPDTFEKWEEVKKWLESTRKNLK